MYFTRKRPSRHRLWPVFFSLLLCSVAMYLSLIPAVAELSQSLRWGVHFALLFLFTFCLIAVLRISFGYRLGIKWELCLALLVAVLMEAGQVVLPLHSPDPWGFVVNVYGAIAAAGVVAVLDAKGVRAGRGCHS